MVEKIIEWSAKNRFLVFIGLFFILFWGAYVLRKMPLDAIPDLSDVQVIVYTEWTGRSPDIVEDQITYPLVTALLAAPRVKTVRGYSFFGYSFVYVIFEDGTDIYWARSRVLEYLQGVNLPPDARIELGPDATGVGWGFQYALRDKTGKCDLACLRTLQDWYIRYWLESVPGVAEVASVGGFVKQYQIILDPVKLLAYNIPVKLVIDKVRRSNNDVGGRLIEISGTEYFVRGRGYIRSVTDIENIVLKYENGTPVLVRDVGYVTVGPEIRRGVAELNGEGEVVGGVVVVRFGENMYDVIQRVKKRIEEIKPALPEGVEIVTTYDRSDLIERAVDTLKEKLIEESIIVIIVCAIFLFHLPSALIVILTLPVAVLMSLILMYHLKITSNIMSLGGIAIAIGAMVDAIIVMIENVHKYLEKWEEEGKPKKSRLEVMIDAMRLVGRPLFFSLLIITVSFFPVFALEAQEGRLFKPLAYTKTFAMLFASFISITLTPALITLVIRGKIIPEHKNPIAKILISLYTPFVRFVLRFRVITIAITIAVIVVTYPVFKRLGSEFMPPLNEGSILYMPTTLPGISITEAGRLLQIQDRILVSFPEVLTVFGKAGKADTSTDPAPLSMIETTVILKPKDEWPCRVTKDYAWIPDFLSFIRPLMKKVFGECRPWTWEELISNMDRAMRFPGVTNAWTMPIKARIDMLTTGIRTPIGIKIFGSDLNVIENIGKQIEAALRDLPGTRSVYAERVVGGYFVDFVVKREVAARYGLTVEDVQDIIQTAIGGMVIDYTVEGRERYPIQVRYARDFRDDIEKLKRVLVPTPSGAQVPIEQLADIRLTMGPPSIKDENGSLTGWVYVDIEGVDIGTYVKMAKKRVQEMVEIPPGYWLMWSGQYEYMQRAMEKLRLILPVTLVVIFVLLYINFRSVTETLIVMLSLPFAVSGAFLLLWILNYNISVAVWVGIIALAGVAAETGVVMIIYLDEALEIWRREGKLKTVKDLYDAVMYGAVQRVRPKLMTVASTIMGLLPIMWSTGTGADVMKRIAAPMIGGMVTSTILTLLVIPTIYFIWKRFTLKLK